MKKLALLLGALSLVSSVAYAKEVVPAVEEVVVVEEAAPVAAAPALTVTHVGQYIEIDNYSRHVGADGAGADTDDIGTVMLGNVVGLAYEDWTFGLMARKGWAMDTDDGIHSNGHRLELDFWKNYENFSVGAIWRQEAEFDRYLARVKYSHGMFSGDLAAGYKFNNNDANDCFYAEGMPVAVTVGPVKVGYYFEYSDFNGTADKDSEGKLTEDMTEETLHQVRVSAPLYTGEKLSLGAEYRYQFEHDKEFENKVAWQENNRHIAILNANYAVTDALSVYGYYQYEFNKYEAHDGGEKYKDLSDDYYGEFVIGWNYAF